MTKSEAEGGYGCVLRPSAFHVPEVLPLQLLSLIRCHWGQAAAEAAETRITNLSRDQLLQAIQRCTYAQRVEDLFQSPSLGSRIVLLDELIRRAIADPLRSWCIQLIFRTTGDRERDERELARNVPWLNDIEAGRDLRWSLRRNGWALLTSSSASEMERLYGSIAPGRISPALFDPLGRRSRRNG